MPEIDISLIIGDNTIFTDEVLRPIRDSISEKGLFHPILVQEVPASAAYPISGTVRIVAGKKRLRALQQLQRKTIEVRIYPSELSQDQILELSLNENLARDNTTWYEQVEMRKALHELRQRLNGKSHRGGEPDRGKVGWTQADTAKELGISIGLLSEDLLLAREVALDPSLSKVKDKFTALKLVKAKGKRMESEAFALIPSDFEMNQVFLGDSESVLKQLPPLIFDVCITDPPWSTYQRDESLTAEQTDLLPIFREIYRTLKNDSFLFIITSSIDQIHYMQELPKIGFTVQNYPLIWVKNRTITHGRRNWQFARDYEPIIVAVKGNPSLNSGTEISSILNYRNLHHTKMIHPNEKPIELLRQIIRNCSYEGNCIVDPFAGSGVMLEAAKELKRNYIGIEKDQSFYKGIIKRLEQTK